jgi:hypothetical protein
MAEEQQKNERWEVVDVEGLSRTMAEHDWKERTNNVHTDDLWIMNALQDPVTGDVEIIKEIRPFWAGEYWGLKEAYDIIIEQFIKKEE